MDLSEETAQEKQLLSVLSAAFRIRHQEILFFTGKKAQIQISANHAEEWGL